jgi:hypothetical protein
VRISEANPQFEERIDYPSPSPPQKKKYLKCRFSNRTTKKAEKRYRRLEKDMTNT